MRKPGKVALLAAAVLMLGGGIPTIGEGGGSADSNGFLYGTVHTEGGRRYTGVLRWDDEEAFWDDLFNGAKSKLPYIDRLPEDQRGRRAIRRTWRRTRSDAWRRKTRRSRHAQG